MCDQAHQDAQTAVAVALVCATALMQVLLLRCVYRGWEVWYTGRGFFPPAGGTAGCTIGIIWTACYTTQAVARAASLNGTVPCEPAATRDWIFGLFLADSLLNNLWCLTFFGWHRERMALGIILLDLGCNIALVPLLAGAGAHTSAGLIGGITVAWLLVATGFNIHAATRPDVAPPRHQSTVVRATARKRRGGARG